MDCVYIVFYNGAAYKPEKKHSLLGLFVLQLRFAAFVPIDVQRELGEEISYQWI